jgi:hypothetical protein
LANRLEEKAALATRYQSVIEEAPTRGTEAVLQAFESALANSEAVINRSLGELIRLAHSDSQIYATFYQRVQAGVIFPGGDKWDRLRALADTVLYGDKNKSEVRFAALTLNDFGLENYGECSLVLKRDMVAHRANVFEENSVLFMRRHEVQAKDDYAIPVGYRAGWAERGLLAVAKLGKAIAPDLLADDFNELVLKSGADGESDHFIEVHIWGPLTIRSFHRVTVRQWKSDPSTAQLKALEEKLTQFSIVFCGP